MSGSTTSLWVSNFSWSLHNTLYDWYTGIFIDLVNPVMSILRSFD